jgi:hypothetical protein
MGTEPIHRNVRLEPRIGLVAAPKKIEWNSADPAARCLREHPDHHQDDTDREYPLLRTLAREHFAQFKGDEQKAGQFEQVPDDR